MSNLRNKKIWFFIGALDELKDFYWQGVELWEKKLQASVSAEIDVETRHSFPTKHGNVTAACDSGEFVVDCSYDVVGQILLHSFQPKNSNIANIRYPADDWAEVGELLDFDQRQYDSDGTAKLASTGQYFISKKCKRDGGCRINLALHGCGGLTDDFITKTGYLNWAANNDFIVIFPAVIDCWDLTGETGADFATKNGRQVVALISMIDAVREEKLHLALKSILL